MFTCNLFQTKYSSIAEEQVSIAYFYAGTKRILPEVSLQPSTVQSKQFENDTFTQSFTCLIEFYLEKKYICY